MQNQTIAAAVLALAVAGSATAARAQSATGLATPRVTGFVVDGSLLMSTGTTITGKGDTEGTFKAKMGPGAGLMIGYGVTPSFMPYLSVDVARQGSDFDGVTGSFGVSHAELGVRAHFPMAGSRLVPYGNVAYGQRGFGGKVTDQGGQSSDLRITGSEFNVGGSIWRGRTRTRAFCLRARWTTTCAPSVSG